VKTPSRSGAYREAVLVFGLTAVALVVSSLLFQLWLSSGPSGGPGPVWGTVFAMLSGGLILLAGALYVRLVSKRVRHLLRGFEAIRSGEYPLLLVEGDDDISRLVVGFNQMVEELRSRHERLTELVEAREPGLDRISRTTPPRDGAQLGSLLEKSSEGLIVTDRDGRIVLVNEQVSEILGLPRSALAQVELSALVEQVRHRLLNPWRVEQQLGDFLRGAHEPGDMVLELDGPEGPTLRLYSAPVRGSDGQLLARIVTSIERGNEREVDRLKTEFLSTISHELRTPLTSVKGALGLIHGGAAGTITADTRELLEIASSNIDRLINVINNILDVLTLERGQATFRLSSMSLAECITRAVELVGEQAGRASVTVETRLPTDLARVRGDARRVEQVLVNLLTNALKFSAQGQKVVVGASANDGTVTVSVQDFGKGISKEAVGRLFQKFEHSEEALTRRTQGAGLGLAICRHVVEAHGGRIWVESTEGVGSTFFFTLPAEPGVVDPISLRRTAERAGGLA
jgi:signal transduction histidine kinase